MKTTNELKLIDIDKLIPYVNNARTHSAEQINKIRASLREFGFINPVIIDRDYNVIAGHGRIMAAREENIKQIPCVFVDYLSEAQKKAYILADNRMALDAGWNEEMLKVELAQLQEMNFDLELTGFDLPEINDLLDITDTEISEDDFEIEVPDEPKAKLGDIYQLGQHRLMCGDSTDEESVKTLMDGEKADMVFTDPPYGVAIGDKNEALNSVQKAGRCTKNIANDTLGENELYELLKNAFINVKANCAEDAVYFVTSPQGGSLGLMMMMMRDAGLEVRHVLMWKKNCATFSLGRLDYDYQHEPMFYTWGEKHHNFRGGENRTTVWEYDKPRKCDLHPTMKPIALVANAIKDGTKEGMRVLDVFGGSGTTLIACEETNRKCYMMELDPHYVDVIINRWETLTGQKAQKLN